MLFEEAIKILIDNLTSTNVYVEKRILINITLNTNASNGIIEKDDNDNSLVNMVDSGDTPLYRLKSYITDINEPNSVMFYNDSTKHLRIAEVGDSLSDVTINYDVGTKYYCGAKRIKVKINDDGNFIVDLTGLNIFKLFLDSREITGYTIKDNQIVITGINAKLIDMFSELVLYVYSSKQANRKIEIEYYNYNIVWNYNIFTNDIDEYFEGFNGITLETFESFNISSNVTKTTYKNNFNYANKIKINAIDNIADLEVYNGSGFVDVTQFVGADEFRIILINAGYGRTVIVNNCRLTNGINLTYDKSKNTKKLNITCGNYIDILIGSGHLYGRELYGRELYGGNYWITNSHRSWI